MQIRIESLRLTNFKGIKSLTVNFNDETFINGANGTGKTTVFDAFTWLLFGKDSTDRTDFNIKPLDENGKTTDKIDVEVCGIFNVDGQNIEFKRVFREKWTKKRSNPVPVFTGNETIYSINDLPVKANEYNSKVQTIIDEKLFKLITSPSAFNALPWKDQRHLLTEIAGTTTQEDVLESMDMNSDDKQRILNMLAVDSNLDNHRKAIRIRIKAHADELEKIPTRIDEAERSKPEPVDVVKLNEDKSEKEKQLSEIDEIIQNESKAIDAQVQDLKAKKSELYRIDNDRADLSRELRKQAKEATRVDTTELDELRSKQKMIERSLEMTSDVENLETKVKTLREEWSATNAKDFEMNPSDECCPTCRRQLDNVHEVREQLKNNFNADKARKLERINQDGKHLNDELKKRIKAKAELENELSQVKSKINQLSKQSTPTESEEDVYQRLLKSSKEIQDFDNRFDALEKMINDSEKNLGQVDEGLKFKRDALRNEIQQINNELSTVDQIQKTNQRIEELKSEEVKISQAITKEERTLYLIERLTNEHIEQAEQAVNGLFVGVQFKMFEEQINGGINENCICTMNGVDYKDLNTASKVNAGLEIISVLNNHFKVSAPIFIDNRESVTQLFNVDSQLINLVVSPDDKQIRIS